MSAGITSSMLFKPLCNKCGKEVDDVILDRDLLNNLFIIIAFCHGEQETKKITDEQLLGGESVYDALDDLSFFDVEDRLNKADANLEKNNTKKLMGKVKRKEIGKRKLI